ncbi:MAG: hypothetical protein PHV43_00885 [Candidatus Colwellbacteria bacterium]|nr:hypothetical protein [Candidatus Colwellbacteria bacterium]
MGTLADLLEDFAPGVLWVVFFVVMLFTVAVAVALSYHWREYAVDSHKNDLMFRGYLIVAGIFAFIMLMAILFY